MSEQKRFGPLHKVLGDKADSLMSHGLPRLKYEGLENLPKLNTEIENGGSVLFVTNHESHLDILLIAKLIQENILAPHTLSVLASIYFFDGTMDVWTAGIAHYLAAKYNYKLLPVAPDWDPRYINQKATINSETSTEARRLLRGGKSILGLAPTGTRNKGGITTKAHAGAGIFANYATLIAPFAVENTRHLLPKAGIPNPLARAKLTVGEPITLDQLLRKYGASKKEAHHALMRELLQYVNPKYWGYYAAK